MLFKTIFFVHPTYILMIFKLKYIYIYIYIRILYTHVFCPSQDLSVWLELTSREQLTLRDYSKHKVLSFVKMLVVWWTNRKCSVLISVVQSALGKIRKNYNMSFLKFWFVYCCYKEKVSNFLMKMKYHLKIK